MTRDDVGLCADCRHARSQTTARGSLFWRCLRAETDPTFVRYPPLPVRACPGYEATSAAGSGPTSEARDPKDGR